MEVSNTSVIRYGKFAGVVLQDLDVDSLHEVVGTIQGALRWRATQLIASRQRRQMLTEERGAPLVVVEQ